MLPSNARETDSRPTRSTKAKRIAIPAILCALIASVSANAALVHAALHYFEASEAVRLDPGGLKMYASEQATPPPGGPLLVFFGDSRAFMWPAPTESLGYRVVNRGVSFQTTAQMLLRIEADMAALHPAVVVVEAGVNDLKTIASFPERRPEIIAECEANLQRIVDRCRQTGATVVLASVFSIGDVPLWRRPFWSDDVAVAIREVNAFLPKLAGEKVVLFDANPTLADERGVVRRAYQLDYIHLSSAGYTALNAKLVPVLTALPR